MAKKKKPIEGSLPLRIPPHNHCVVCGKAIPEGEKLCSEECEAAFNKAKRAKLMQFVYMLILVFILLLFLYGGK